VLDFATCNAARLRRDPAYDGVFFIAVRTTMIYCRPVCRVRQPLTKNVTFYPSAAACERAGYRPCLRCRPEAAPFSPAWQGTRTTVERALKLIHAGALGTGTMEALAGRLGIGPRHLGRLFNEHLGASPLQVAKTLRVQRAKTCLNEGAMGLDDIAAHAGFRNARRMNAAFLALYGRTPASMRRQPSAPTRRDPAPRHAPAPP
jgi:AraC family transcriptional regulator of adaptative response / DNA-3-methyladenine glycosylase II